MYFCVPGHMVAGVDFMGEEFEEQVAFAKLLSCGPAPLSCPKGQINKKGKTTNRKPKKCCELVMNTPRIESRKLQLVDLPS